MARRYYAPANAGYWVAPTGSSPYETTVPAYGTPTGVLRVAPTFGAWVATQYYRRPRWFGPPPPPAAPSSVGGFQDSFRPIAFERYPSLAEASQRLQGWLGQLTPSEPEFYPNLRALLGTLPNVAAQARRLGTAATALAGLGAGQIGAATSGYLADLENLRRQAQEAVQRALESTQAVAGGASPFTGALAQELGAARKQLAAANKAARQALAERAASNLRQLLYGTKMGTATVGTRAATEAALANYATQLANQVFAEQARAAAQEAALRRADALEALRYWTEAQQAGWTLPAYLAQMRAPAYQAAVTAPISQFSLMQQAYGLPLALTGQYLGQLANLASLMQGADRAAQLSRLLGLYQNLADYLARTTHTGVALG